MGLKFWNFRYYSNVINTFRLDAGEMGKREIDFQNGIALGNRTAEHTIGHNGNISKYLLVVKNTRVTLLTELNNPSRV